MPFWQRLSQLTNPPAYQATLFAEHPVVSVPPQLGLPGMVAVSGADDVRALLAREGDLTGPAHFFGLGELIDAKATDFMNQPATHRAFREMMRPAFDAHAIAHDFLPDIVDVISAALAGAAARGGAVPGYEAMKRMTFEIIMRAMLGRAYADAEVDHLHALYGVYTAGMFTWPQLELPFLPYGRAMAARRQLLAIFKKDIAAARAAHAAGGRVAGQLGVMVSARGQGGELAEGLTDAAIAELLLGLLFAGHDTTSSSLTQIIAVLQEHPAVVERLREEQRRLVAAHGSGVGAAVLRDMEYGEAVIRESMRLLPTSSELFRTAARDLELGGARVDKGSLLSLPLAHVSAADPRWAGAAGDMAPGVFNPDRMLTPEGRRPGDQLAFGHGPRHCLGVHLAMAEMKVFIALWARGYAIAADTNTRWRFAVGRVPLNGLPMTVAPVAA